MQAVLDSFLAGFPVLMLHSSVTIAMLVAGVLVYVWITPWDEVKLIRAGNTAAAVSMGGAVIGLAIPLAFAMASTTSRVWYAIASTVARTSSARPVPRVMPTIVPRARASQ